ncbi:MAG: hypothetical protein M0Z66_03710 [Thermaerobacter sp.]|nr:hypothetical protein [Thermaerobacter sp.]
MQNRLFGVVWTPAGPSRDTCTPFFTDTSISCRTPAPQLEVVPYHDARLNLGEGGTTTTQIAFLPGRRDDLKELDAALAELLGTPVRTREVRRRISAISGAAQLVDTPEEPEVGVLVTVNASTVGSLLLLFSPKDARRIGHLLGEGDASQERLLDACSELAMIVAGRYLAVLERFSTPSGIPTPPVSAVDMQAAIVESTVAQAGASAMASVFEIAVALSPQPLTMRLLVLT